MPTTSHEPETDLVTRRDIPFPPSQVLAAFLDPVRLARWWGPAGFRVEFEACETTPGGSWRFTMIGPNGARFPNESQFARIAPDRLVIEHISAPWFVLTVTLREAPGGTALEWRQRFESPEVRQRVEPVEAPGSEQNLDRLVQELERGGGRGAA